MSNDIINRYQPQPKPQHTPECDYWDDGIEMHCTCRVRAVLHRKREEEKEFQWWIINSAPDLDPYADSEWASAINGGM